MDDSQDLGTHVEWQIETMLLLLERQEVVQERIDRRLKYLCYEFAESREQLKECSSCGGEDDPVSVFNCGVELCSEDGLCVDCAMQCRLEHVDGE